MNIGETQVAYKTSSTPKTNSTFAPDPHLKLVGLVAGETYSLDGFHTIDADSAAGYKWRIVGDTTGTPATISGDCSWTGQTQLADPGIGLTTGKGAKVAVVKTTMQHQIGNVQCSASGDIVMEWAQHTTDVNDTVMQQNCKLILTRLT